MTYGLALRPKHGAKTSYARIGLVLLSYMPTGAQAHLLGLGSLGRDQYVEEYAKFKSKTNAFLSKLPISTVIIE